MIVGDRMTSLLQIVTVDGKSGDIVEKRYDSPLFNRVLSKEIHVIGVEIRSMEGRPIKFEYGIVILTLMFKRVIYF